MTTVIVPQSVPQRIHGHRFARNGQPVDPTLINQTTEALNNALAFRGKEIFRSSGVIPATGNAVVNWNRFYYHSTPYVRDVKVRFLLARDNKGGGGTDSATLTLTSGAFTGTATANVGALAEVTGSFDEMLQVDKVITGVPADVDVAGVLSINNSRVISVCAWELPPAFDTANGYLLAGYGTNQPMYDAHRSGLVTLSNLIMRRGGSHVFNWCVNNDAVPKAIASATDTNIIDGSTLINSATAGYTLDLTNKKRFGSTKVATIIAHYGFVSAGSGGTFKVKRSSGTTMATISGINTTPQWRTTNLDMADSVEKYDLMHSTTAGTLNTIAVSCFQYET